MKHGDARQSRQPGLQTTVGDVREELERHSRPLAYTTVMTVMARLATKRILVRRTLSSIRPVCRKTSSAGTLLEG